MDNTMKKRWISLYVENQVGVLSKISGLFSGKSYNLESLTVGRTEDPTISRMTIETNSDEETYEQIKKQLNRMVEVIRVIDFTDPQPHLKAIEKALTIEFPPQSEPSAEQPSTAVFVPLRSSLNKCHRHLATCCKHI